MATARVHQPRHAGLGLDNEGEHAWVEVRARLAAGALGDVDDRRVGGLITVRTAIDLKAGTLEMGKGRRKPPSLRCRRCDKTVQCCHPTVVERIAGTSERVIVEMAGFHGRSDALRGGDFEKNAARGSAGG